MVGRTSKLRQQRRQTAIELARQGTNLDAIAAFLGVGRDAVVKYLEGVEGLAPGLLHTRQANQVRRALIVELAAEGHDEEAIAQRVGMTPESVRLRMRRDGVPTLADRLGRVHRTVDSNRAMDGIVSGAQPSPEAIAAIDWAALDPTRLAGWLCELSAAIGELQLIRTRLRKEIREHAATS